MVPGRFFPLAVLALLCAVPLRGQDDVRPPAASPLVGIWVLETSGDPKRSPAAGNTLKLITESTIATSYFKSPITRGTYTTSGNEITEERGMPDGRTLTFRWRIDQDRLEWVSPTDGVTEVWRRLVGTGPFDQPPLAVLGCASDTLGDLARAALAGRGRMAGPGSPTAMDAVHAAVSAAPSNALTSLHLARCHETLRHAVQTARILRQAREEVGRARASASPAPVPAPLNQPRTDYPNDAQRLNVSGVVVLEGSLDANGRLRDPRVVKSIPMLDDAALAHARDLRYAPPGRGGAPQAGAASITVPVVFRSAVSVVDHIDTALVLFERRAYSAAESAIESALKMIAPEVRVETLAGQQVPAGEFGAGAWVLPRGDSSSPFTVRVVRDVRPAYTGEAMRARIQGTVRLHAVISPDGRVANVRVVRSLDPVHGLDESAVTAARQWTFTPPTDANGKAVSVLATLDLSFRIF